MQVTRQGDLMQSMTRRWAPRSILAALVLSMLVASACGSDVKDADLRAAAAQSRPAPQAAAPDPGATTDTGGTTAAGPAAAGAGEVTGQTSAGTGSGAATSAVPAAGSKSVARSGGGSTAAPAPNTKAGSGANSGASGSPAAGSGGTGSGAAPGKATPGTPSAPDAPGAPTGPKSEIRLGSIGTDSGPVGAIVANVKHAAKAWAADINARGGLNGHPINLIFADDGADPSKALSLTRRMVEEDKVIAIYAEHGPTTFQAIVPYLQEKGVPVVGTDTGNPAIDGSPIVFQFGVGSTQGMWWNHVLPLITQSSKRKVGLFYCRDVPSCKQLRDGVNSIKGQAGIDIVYEGLVSVAQPDFTAEVIQARNSGADALITIMDQASVVRIARSAHRQGYTPVISAQHSLHNEDFIKNGGQDVEGVVLASSVASWEHDPKMADYRAAMDKYVPTGQKGSMGAQNWVAGKALEKIAARFSPNPTSAEIIAGLQSFHLETLGGLIPPTTFEAGKTHEAVNLCSIMLRVEGGKFVLNKGPEDFECAPGWKPAGS
jgi:branched-chain amino acid transport system substrate-binding protein